MLSVPSNRKAKLEFMLTAIKPTAHQWRDDEIELMQSLANILRLKIDRATAQELLRSSESHLRRVINNQLGLVGVIDLAGSLAKSMTAR